MIRESNKMTTLRFEGETLTLRDRTFVIDPETHKGAFRWIVESDGNYLRSIIAPSLRSARSRLKRELSQDPDWKLRIELMRGL
jgi:hypothetical protein